MNMVNTIKPDNTLTDSTLTKVQMEQYREQGYLFPISALSNDEVARYRGAIEDMEELQGHTMDRIQCNKSYLLYDWADEIVHHPAIVDKVEALIGPDVLCYMTNLFIKDIDSKSYVSMHQDAAYWGVDADDVVTAWVALSPAKKESGVMKVEPGSHKSHLPLVNTYAKDNLLTRGQEIPATNLNPANHVYMELEPGQMSLHHFMLAHGSEANTSDDRRIGFAIRYVSAHANKIGKPESALLIRGQNQSNFLMEKRAKDLSRGERYAEHARALRRQASNLFESDSNSTVVEKIRLTLTKYAATGLCYFREFRSKKM